jgi:hypothetical protein
MRMESSERKRVLVPRDMASATTLAEKPQQNYNPSPAYRQISTANQWTFYSVLSILKARPQKMPESGFIEVDFSTLDTRKLASLGHRGICTRQFALEATKGLLEVRGNILMVIRNILRKAKIANMLRRIFCTETCSEAMRS